MKKKHKRGPRSPEAKLNQSLRMKAIWEKRKAGLLPYPPQTFKPGQSGHPGGKPVALRLSINSTFLRDLSEVWQRKGKACLSRLAEDDPSTLAKICASLVPKEFTAEVTHKHSAEMSDDELISLIRGSSARVIDSEACEVESSSIYGIHNAQLVSGEDT